MTIQDFIKYYKNGHGRAICALQNITDKEPYRKAFFECIKEQDFFHEKEEYIITLAKMLLTEETTREFVDILFEKAKSSPQFFNYSVVKILLEYLSRDEVIDFIEAEYDKSFKDYINYASETAPRYLNSKYISTFTAIEKFLGDNDDRLKALIKDGAALYEVNKYLRPNPILRLKHIHHNDKERFSRLFDEALSDNPLYEEMRAIIDKDFSEPKRREYKTPEDFIKGAKDDYNNALESFCKADAETVKRVAEIGIGENTEQAVSALSLFIDYSYEYGREECNHQPFPFDSKCLIDVNEKYKTLYSPEPDTSIEGCWAYMALRALTAMKDDAARQYCVSIITDESVHEMMSYEAFGTFRTNYKPTDAELLKKLYYSGYENEVLMLLLCIARQGIKDIPYEVCFDAYENGTEYNRSHAVFTLSTLGILTDEMIEECKYDTSKNVRDLVNGLPSEDPHIIRNGYRTIKVKK